MTLRAMTLDDLDAVMQVEAGSYSHPWTRGNFSDSVLGGHLAWVLVEGGAAVPARHGLVSAGDGASPWASTSRLAVTSSCTSRPTAVAATRRRRTATATAWADAELLGYLVAMPGVDEMHLLNVTVAPACRRQGHARHLLDQLSAATRERGLGAIWLEVRASNGSARRLYQSLGYVEQGVRRAYYPAGHSLREDAVLMSLDLVSQERLSAPVDEPQPAVGGATPQAQTEAPRAAG